MRRRLSALLVLPLALAGTLVAHAVAYATLGAPFEGVHEYLSHLPQLVTILALPALVLAAVAGRATTPRAWPFAAVALVAFVLQEHAERLLHTGEVPFLLDRPVFWVGLALQVPFALVAWLLARGIGRAASMPLRVPQLATWLAVDLLLPTSLALASATPAGPVSPRGPPVLLQTR